MQEEIYLLRKQLENKNHEIEKLKKQTDVKQLRNSKS